MKKKLVFLMLMLSFVFSYGQDDTAEISQEVTGVSQETLESGKEITVLENIQDEDLSEVDAKLKSDEVQQSKEKLDLAKQQENNIELENELSKDMASDKPLWKYLIGVAAVIIVGVAAF
ncbi:hypothetical protein [uncultured Ilyobacter sp.]|uniref:hypothetical protein n=1 Tax=uncultured Ilyobacter sp. TaxID=544433 RepID=UPI0029F555F9|nr:hypothetical protein [uncultured Ilyobacter sp.]